MNQSDLGITCLTPSNLQSPWMLYEAGALSAALQSSRVCTYLFDLEPAQVSLPLGWFQHTVARDKGDNLKLLKSINERLDEKLSNSALETIFERSWPALEQALEGVTESEESPQRSAQDMLEEVLLYLRAIKFDTGRVDAISRIELPRRSSSGGSQRPYLHTATPAGFSVTSRGEK